MCMWTAPPAAALPRGSSHLPSLGFRISGSCAAQKKSEKIIGKKSEFLCGEGKKKNQCYYRFCLTWIRHLFIPPHVTASTPVTRGRKLRSLLPRKRKQRVVFVEDTCTWPSTTSKGKKRKKGYVFCCYGMLCCSFVSPLRCLSRCCCRWNG